MWRFVLSGWLSPQDKNSSRAFDMRTEGNIDARIRNTYGGAGGTPMISSDGTTVWQWLVILADDRSVVVTAPRSLILEGTLVFRGLPHEKERVGNLVAAFAPGDWKRGQLIRNPFDPEARPVEPEPAEERPDMQKS
jgi:hypothetical protein